MPAVQQHRQSHKRSTELTVSYLGLSKKQVFLFKFGSFGLVAGARIEAPGNPTDAIASKKKQEMDSPTHPSFLKLLETSFSLILKLKIRLMKILSITLKYYDKMIQLILNQSQMKKDLSNHFYVSCISSCISMKKLCLTWKRHLSLQNKTTLERESGWAQSVSECSVCVGFNHASWLRVENRL